MLTSIVIVTWNSEDYLGKCLTSLKHQAGCAIELVIVDNASNDGTVALAKEVWPDAVVLENPVNMGFAKGCNQGIFASIGEWVGTLNPDTVVEPGWLESMQTTIQTAKPDVGMLQSKMYFSDSREINSTGIELTRTAGARDRSFRRRDTLPDDPVDVFCPTAGAAFYRRTMLDQVALNSGYFDEGFFMYWEDVDLGWRCRLSGWKAKYVASAVVRHAYQGAVRKRGPGFATKLIHRNRVASISKNASLPFMLMSVPRTLAELVLSVLNGNFDAVFDVIKAVSYGIRQRREVTEIASVSRLKVEAEWAG